IFVLVGFFIQLLLDFLTKGVEHGHHGCHEHGHGINAYGIMIGICIHSFLEGMPLVDNFADASLKNTLLSGIVIHNIPISIVLVSILSKTGLKKSLIILLLTIFALSAPLGTLSSYFIGSGFQENATEYFNIILAIVVGIFLHISTTILFETDEQHHFNFYKFIAILIGFGFAISLLFVL
ncbi:MAG: ZIP family metal transporter, partial [Bacteroidetes bacterium]|nr:ZIP family metal transporter [Bacteroidota bacterium]